jgi:hypothetical protein
VQLRDDQKASNPLLEIEGEGLLKKNQVEIDELLAAKVIDAGHTAELMQQLAEIQAATSTDPGPAQAGLETAVAKFKVLIEQAESGAKLTGLTELQGILDHLAQIELTKAATESTGTASADASSPESDDKLETRGKALLRLAGATAAAVDAYSGASHADKAQSLIIGAIAVQQKIEVAAVRQSRDALKARSSNGQQTLYLGEVHALAEAGLSLSQSAIKTTGSHDAVLSLAASWDSYRIPGELLPYRRMEADREASIQIAALNAKYSQKVVAAAMEAVNNYAKGGITEAEIADILSKFFIGGAILK